MTKVLITGVNGFVGKTLSDELVIKGCNVNVQSGPVMSVDFSKLLLPNLLLRI